MLGIALTFVGIILVMNGILFMAKSRVKIKDENGKEVETLVPLIVHSPKTIAFFNVIVGTIIIIGNFILLPGSLGGDLPNYVIFQNTAAGLLFGVTYLFIAGNLIFKLDMRAFGIYSIGACIFAIVMSVVGFRDFAVYDGDTWIGIHGLILGILWIIWFFLWFTGVLQFIFKVKVMEKIFPWVSIVIGVVGAFVPAMLLLLGTWPLL